jgi:Ca2+/Na+ antiporter
MSQQSPKLPGDVATSGIGSRTRQPDTRRGPSAGSMLWFVWMVGMWVAFFALLRTERLDGLWSSIRDLPLLAEIVVWFLFMPWMLGTAVWTSAWSEWVRLLLVLTFVVGWTIVSIPRPRKPSNRSTPGSAPNR